MIIQGTVFSWDTADLVFVSKQKPMGLILIFKNVNAPVQINISSDEEVDRQYNDIIREWIKSKKI